MKFFSVILFLSCVAFASASTKQSRNEPWFFPSSSTKVDVRTVQPSALDRSRKPAGTNWESSSQSNNSNRNQSIILSKNGLLTSVAFMGGFMNVICYNSFGFFVNMMTGNGFRAAVAIGESRIADALFFASLVVSYITGTAIFRLMTLHWHNHKSVHVRRATLPILAILFMATDMFRKLLGTEGIHPWFVVPTCLAFGLFNAASSEPMGGTVVYAISGACGKIGSGIVDRFFSEKKRMRSVTKASIRVVLSLMAGVIAGTLLCNRAPWVVSDVNVPLFSCLGFVFCSLLGLYDQRITLPAMTLQEPEPSITVNEWQNGFAKKKVTQ